MPDDRKYVRVYYNDLIRDYPEVWSDNDQLATWLRLLATADPMWPTPPEVPRSVKARHLADLVKSSLVSETLGRFRMKGLDAEREMRAQSGRNAAAKRWHSEGTPPPDAPAMPKRVRAETSKAENEPTARATNDPWRDDEHEARVWLANHGCDLRPGNGYDQKLVTAVQAHGVNAVVGMFDRLAEAGTRNGDIKGFLFKAIDALDERTRPNLGELEKEDRAEDANRSTRAQVDRTKAYLRELRGESA